MHDETSYSSNEAEAKLLLQAADVFVKIPVKPSPFHSVSFYQLVHLSLQDLQQAHLSSAVFFVFSFSEFLEVKVPIRPSKNFYQAAVIQYYAPFQLLSSS